MLQEDLDALVEQGAVAAVAQVRDAEGVRAAAAGLVELGGERAAEPAAWFRIGSVTKTYTATALMQLVGDGAIALDDPVERWLPGLVRAGDRIVLRQLLDHTAGLHNYTSAWFGEGGLNVPLLLELGRTGPSAAEVLADALAQPPNFEPGTSLAYDNTGYLLAAAVIEKAGGRPYEDHVTERILRPLGLDHTHVRWGSELPEPHTHGYLRLDDVPVDVSVYDRAAAGPAGGIAATANDVNRFFAGLLGGDLLAPAELAAMVEPTPWNEEGFRAGLGMIRTKLSNGVEVIGKDGNFLGYHCWSFHTLMADRQLTLSVTSATDLPFSTAEVLARFAYVFV
ncbi:MAG TPA: serine hydrolase domain-containing protein [Micromonosporaceae bacterium]|jgi:D-alanyl-D-alanine carboxypeptidase